MSDHTHDIRTKVTMEDHRVLTAISLATGDDIAAIVRDVLHRFVEAELHRHTVLSNLLRGEGIGGSPGGMSKV